MFNSAASLSGIYCRLGRAADARQILKEMLDAKAQGRFVAALEFAGTYFALGEKDRGMEALREAVKEHDFNLVLLMADPSFDSVRADPEFAALMNEVHLPPAAWRNPPRFKFGK
jgi:pentatricopeptide repeat protein